LNAPVYLLDANVFIEASRRYYAFDIAPRFWGNLEEYAEKGRIQSIDRIKNELKRGGDELWEWAEKNFSSAFFSTDVKEVFDAYRRIMTWVKNQAQFSDQARADFADSADGWLIAYAMVNGYIIVTHEVLAPYARRKVPIPNVCRQFNLSYIDTFEMMRKLGVQWKY